MDRFDIWDGILLLVASYVAVVSLVRLMAAHRKKVTAELEAQFREEQRRKAEEEKDKRRNDKREEAA